jgi:hypothetical protein
MYLEVSIVAICDERLKGIDAEKLDNNDRSSSPSSQTGKRRGSKRFSN